MIFKAKATGWLVGVVVLTLFASATCGHADIGMEGRPHITHTGDTAPVWGTVLDASSYWRVAVDWGTPAVRTADGKIETPVVRGKRLKEWRTPPFPAEWTRADFDDSGWSRAQLPFGIQPRTGIMAGNAGNPGEVHAILARGKFIVRNPAQARQVRISVAFSGGAIVYVNGKELTRAYISPGEPGPALLAEAYPAEATSTPALRLRTAGEIPIPASSLRTGLNVVALRIQRAPLCEQELGKPLRISNNPIGPWPRAMLFTATITAQPGSQIASNLQRPQGMQVWSVPPFESVYGWDFGDPAEQPPSLRIAGAQGQTRSARFAVSGAKTEFQSEALIGLSVDVGTLTHTENGATLSSDALSVRFSLPASREGSWVFDAMGEWKYDCFSDKAPANIAGKDGPAVSLNKKTADPVRRAFDAYLSGAARRSGWQYDVWLFDRAIPPGVQAPEPRAPLPGAVQPVWVTVRFPRDAAAGEYRGTVTVRADGQEPVALPLTVRLYGWQAPDPKDFIQNNSLYNSVDSLAQKYETPLWSDRHWDLIGQSLALGAEIGNKLCSVNMVTPVYNTGNAESMVRWIKKGDGYEHDFSVFDRYLDVFEEQVGKPVVVKLNVWGRFGNARPELYQVSLLDPETGTVERMVQPPYGTPESLAFWKPVLDQVRVRLEKRGWMDVAALGVAPDEGPDPSTVSQFLKIWPDSKWMSSAHPNPTRYKGLDGEFAPAAYVEHVWAAGRPYDPVGEPRPHFFQYGSLKEWEAWQGRAYPRPWSRMPDRVEWAFPRFGVLCIHKVDDSFPLSSWRWLPESALQGNLNGVGNSGLDLLPLPDARGRSFFHLAGNSHMGPQASFRALLSAGPDGPVANERFEKFRDGMQISEAIAFLLQAVDSKTLPADLKDRIEKTLDERAVLYARSRPGSESHWWALNSGARERDESLLALCEETASAMRKPSKR